MNHFSSENCSFCTLKRVEIHSFTFYRVSTVTILLPAWCMIFLIFNFLNYVIFHKLVVQTLRKSKYQNLILHSPKACISYVTIPIPDLKLWPLKWVLNFFLGLHIIIIGSHSVLCRKNSEFGDFAAKSVYSEIFLGYPSTQFLFSK